MRSPKTILIKEFGQAITREKTETNMILASTNAFGFYTTKAATNQFERIHSFKPNFILNVYKNIYVFREKSICSVM